METNLQVQARSVYGVDRIYPLNDQAKKIAKLLNRKTLTSADIVILKDLGFKIEWMPISL